VKHFCNVRNAIPYIQDIEIINAFRDGVSDIKNVKEIATKKPKMVVDLLDDLKETFDNLRKYKMMLNPKKCVFGVSSGKLIDYVVSFQGIDANPKNLEAIEQLQPPRTWKEI
jgi:hypothetical protein